ncbi:hypothetical protein TUST1-182_00390 [Vibrio phage ICP1_2006_C]|nr:hypothetical protein TUST1-191_00390 [Vibrio phage ICP1_2006_D]ADX88351.1 hypothetical protein TUST1-182_00390 [Vibrio phage ICP1_2006_C]
MISEMKSLGKRETPSGEDMVYSLWKHKDAQLCW